MTRIELTLAECERIGAKILLSDDASQCWLYRGSKDESYYARIWFRGRNWHGTRLMYQTHRGPLREDEEVHHTCDRRSCINPWHLQKKGKVEHRQLTALHTRRRRRREAAEAREAAKRAA